MRGGARPENRGCELALRSVTPDAGRLAKAANETYGHSAGSILNRGSAPTDRSWAGLGSVSSTDQVR